MKLEGFKGYQLAEQNFPEKKIILGGKKYSSKVGIFGFCQKLNPLMYLFLP